MTPIQPRLAESNLFLISAGGPAGLSFNEFHPLFNRNGINFQTTGLAGENKTYAGEGVLSGIYNKAAFSLGGFHFQTDGFRTNADQRDTIANGFLQVEFSPKTTIQAEFRHRDSKQGDLRQRLFPEDFFPGVSNNADTFTARVGGRHSFSPHSVLLGSFMFQDRDTKVVDKLPVAPILTFVDLKRPQQAFGFELQHLLRLSRFSLTSGLGYFDIDERLRTTVGTIFPPPFDQTTTSTDTGVQHLNGYVYGHIDMLKNLTLTLGASFDYLKGSRARIPGGDEDQLNPKFGITWNPFSETTVRAGVSRVLKRTLLTDQTLEPTQVAGFNQFFDDADLTESWRFGAGIDQKISNNIFGGVEFSKRDLKIPLVDTTVSPTITRRLDGEEYLGRTYLFWTPSKMIAIRGEYIFERFENDRLLEEPLKLNTHRVPIGLNLFHPSGLSASLTATYYNQDGRFPRLGGVQRGESDFWTVDASINYRLPKRYGFLTMGAANLFDRRFKYFETDRDNLRIQPDRVLFVRVTLALP
jgi:hypothetical protein